MRKRYKLVQGVGINDVDLPTHHMVNGKMTSDPYYRSWKSMLTRCYDLKIHQKHPTYANCTVCEEWKYFSNFKRWMEAQDWEGKHLDKDLLFGGNKVYSPETCLFVNPQVNKILLLSGRTRGATPVGVNYHIRDQKYQAQCHNKGGRIQHLGYYDNALEAHAAWQLFKIGVVEDLKGLQSDPLVRSGLERVCDKIQDDYNNQRETMDFN